MLERGTVPGPPPNAQPPRLPIFPSRPNLCTPICPLQGRRPRKDNHPLSPAPPFHSGGVSKNQQTNKPKIRLIVDGKHMVSCSKGSLRLILPSPVSPNSRPQRGAWGDRLCDSPPSPGLLPPEPPKPAGRSYSCAPARTPVPAEPYFGAALSSIPSRLPYTPPKPRLPLPAAMAFPCQESPCLKAWGGAGQSRGPFPDPLTPSPAGRRGLSCEHTGTFQAPPGPLAPPRSSSL